MIVVVWVIVAAITLMRAIAVFQVPIVGDEAYYWEWSRRLAFGYTDHPPAVAATIAAFSWLGLTPGAVRIGFVLCGVVATLATAAAATQVAKDVRAGAVAALAFTLVPLFQFSFGIASPDGPYLAFWCLSLWLALRATDAETPPGRSRTLAYIGLGLAMGGLVLSRFFGFALVFGVAAYALFPQRRHLWREGLGISFAICALAFAPFVWWNATHDWVTFVFTFFSRHVSEGFSIRRVLGLYAVQAAAYSPGIFLAALLCVVRPRNALIEWTAAPLLALLTILAFFERIEVHWAMGAFASLCAALGPAFLALRGRTRVVWFTASAVPSLLLIPTLFIAAVAPGPIYQAFRDTGSTLRHTGPFEIFTYRPLARDVKVMAAQRDAIVMTDGYGLSSMLDFDAGIYPVVIGYDAQGLESRWWYPSDQRPAVALYVDKERIFPPDGRPDILEHLRMACERVVPGPTKSYSYAGVPPREYYTAWCEGMRADGMRVLRWENPAERRRIAERR